MQDPVYAKIEGQPRPTLFASSGFVLLAAVGLWASTLIEIALSVTGMGIADMLYYLPFLLLPLAVYMARHPGLSRSMRLNPLPLLPTLSVLALSLLTVFAASLLSAAWSAGLDGLGLHSPGSNPSPGTEAELMLSILTMAAMPAVCEELLFRGFLLAAWESRGTWFAVGVTAALFALLHGNLYGLPAYLLGGAIAGFLAVALDSVYAAMVYHTGYNAACLILPWLVSGQEAEQAAAGAPASLSLVLEALTLAAMMAMLLSSLRLRAHRAGVTLVPRIRRPLSRPEKWMLAAAVGAMAVTLLLVLMLS